MVPFAHVVHGPACHVPHLDARHVDDEEESVDLSVLVTRAVSTDDGRGTQLLR